MRAGKDEEGLGERKEKGGRGRMRTRTNERDGGTKSEQREDVGRGIGKICMLRENIGVRCGCVCVYRCCSALLLQHDGLVRKQFDVLTARDECDELVAN